MWCSPGPSGTYLHIVMMADLGNSKAIDAQLSKVPSITSKVPSSKYSTKILIGVFA